MLLDNNRKAIDMNDLLDDALCNSLYDVLNDTSIFYCDTYLKEKHSQVCAALDRLRHAATWINAHQETPKGMDAPTQLMIFMMFASVIKSTIETLRASFGLCDTLFDKGHPDCHKFFKCVCMGEPLRIPEQKCPTDDAFFQYFRSLVFAHSGMVTLAKSFLLEGEIQYCPYIVEDSLKESEDEPDDYVGVKIYSSIEARDGTILRIRFSTLKEYLKSRYNSLSLVISAVEKRYKKYTETWKNVHVDNLLPPLDQLKFMRSEFEKRCENELVYETQKLINLLECPCSMDENQARVKMFREEIMNCLPRLSAAFTNLDYATYVEIVDHMTPIEIDESRKLNYTLRKGFEALRSSDKRNWARRDIDSLAKSFVDKWAKIDQSIMTDNEIIMLLTMACYYERTIPAVPK